ncbi:MAG: hypothetical protein Q8S73_10165 [Deltaproteobacteria bacterium]|nr:hypothetical protein [Myxococcales bacterium]MDP3214458.1 hypothetical protein [Deltaproteobacteria bacterium]
MNARPPWSSRAGGEAALATLRRTLRRGGTQFAFVPVVVDDESREEVVRALRGWAGHEGVPALTIFPASADGAGKFDLLLRGGLDPVEGVVIPDGDALVNADEGRLAAGLNLSRDHLGRWVRGPLVVLLSDEGATALARAVPDLHDVRAGSIEIRGLARSGGGEDPEWDAICQEANRLLVDGGGGDVTNSELLELARWATTYGNRMDRPRRARDARQIAEVAADRAYHRAQEQGQFLEVLEAWFSRSIARWSELTPDQQQSFALEAHQKSRDLGHPIKSAEALGMLAKSLATHGNIDRAMKLIRDNVAPAFISHNRPDVVFNLLMITAEEMMRSSRHADALKVLSELERLDLPSASNESSLHVERAHAYCFMKIGRLDQAITTYSDRVLPLARQLGSTPDIAVAERETSQAYAMRAGPGDLDLALIHAEAAAMEAERANMHTQSREARAFAATIEHRRSALRPPGPNRAARRSAHRQTSRR